MTTWFRINTAVVICLAFFFRLLIVSAPVISGLMASGAKGDTKHSSFLKKRRLSSEIMVQSSTREYAAVEVCEENAGSEENELKNHTPILLSFVYAVFRNLDISTGSNASFDSIKCYLYPKRHLAFSILRI